MGQRAPSVGAMSDTLIEVRNPNRLREAIVAPRVRLDQRSAELDGNRSEPPSGRYLAAAVGATLLTLAASWSGVNGLIR